MLSNIWGPNVGRPVAGGQRWSLGMAGRVEGATGDLRQGCAVESYSFFSAELFSLGIGQGFACRVGWEAKGDGIEDDKMGSVIGWSISGR